MKMPQKRLKKIRRRIRHFMEVTVVQAFRSGILLGLLVVLLGAMFLSYIVFPLIDLITEKMEKMVIKMIIQDIRKVTKLKEGDDE